MAIEIPAEYGGTDASFTTAIIAIEELAKVDPSISVMADVHVSVRKTQTYAVEYTN
jgi:short-chain 2-methylacyl-CoA dehydrogenase